MLNKTIPKTQVIVTKNLKWTINSYHEAVYLQDSFACQWKFTVL